MHFHCLKPGISGTVYHILDTGDGFAFVNDSYIQKKVRSSTVSRRRYCTIFKSVTFMSHKVKTSIARRFYRSRFFNTRRSRVMGSCLSTMATYRMYVPVRFPVEGTRVPVLFTMY